MTILRQPRHFTHFNDQSNHFLALYRQPRHFLIEVTAGKEKTKICSLSIDPAEVKKLGSEALDKLTAKHQSNGKTGA